ncbi:MAG: type I restriction enzyme HsdR N-terminal domain-containing protein [Bacteroidia bacterium]|nr:type I restriction enzyme HsdR N-terminal domain-containing protein [Bacteroidia bacterium]
MKSKKLYNVLEGFDFELLDSPEFKEDSVREEIILPIIKGLGYNANKPNQIIRSKNLLHPFVSIGSQRKDIYIIPDYLFQVNDKPAWILDAKSPTELLLKSKHVEQAYSYAIHSEVRVKFFALCNGIDFVLYNIEKIKPVLHFPIKALPLYWDTLKGILAPENVFELCNLQVKKDLGSHLKRLGFDSFESLIFPEVPITHIGQLDPDFYTLSGAVIVDGYTYIVSFDFGENVFKQLNGKIPKAGYDILSKREDGSRCVVKFAEEVFFINVDCKIGDNLEENDKEIFRPMWVNRLL